MSTPVPGGIAHRVYSVLVEFAGASSHRRDRNSFVSFAASNGITEYRFCGSLGFGGKVRNAYGRLYVTCYKEDETPERLATIAKTNAELAALVAQIRGAL